MIFKIFIFYHFLFFSIKFLNFFKFLNKIIIKLKILFNSMSETTSTQQDLELSDSSEVNENKRKEKKK